MKKSSENSEFIQRLKPKFACSQCSVIHNHHDTGGKQKRKVKEIIVAAFFVYEPITFSGFTLARIQGI